MSEIWREHSSYRGYLVSDHGRIRGRRGFVLKPYKTTDGYLRTAVWDASGNKIFKLVHVLVLETFIGERPPNWHACHYDGNGFNNVLSNLRWDSVKENDADKQRHGRRAHGNRGGASKLTGMEVVEIIQSNARQAQLGRFFGISTHAVWMIKNRRTYREFTV